jgi:hypothetical protein
MKEGMNGSNHRKEEAVKNIQYVRQQVYTMGGNDSEIPILNQLIKLVEEGNINPDDAVIEATNILERKQDYH